MQRAPGEALQAPPVKQSEESETEEKHQPRRIAMTSLCRLALQRSHLELMRDLDVNRTLDFLFAKMVLTLEDKQEIHGKQNENERRSSLLEILPQRGQGAYDQLLECLEADQPWLKEILQKHHSNIADDDLAWEEQTRDQRKVESTAELVDDLRENLKENLSQWKTALEQGFADEEGLIPYIDQPYALAIDPQHEHSDAYSNLANGPTRLAELDSGGPKEQTDASRSIKLIEDSTPGERIFLYGGPGMGKTTLLKEIARSWTEKTNSILVDKFMFMFLIPLRFVGKVSLLNTICEELELSSISNVGELEKSLHRNERKVVFLLDSYDELRPDVIQEDKSDIGKLIIGTLFPKSTVLVTSRPGYQLGKSRHQKVAWLADLPEDKVRKVTIKHLDEDQATVDKVLHSFPAMAFLQKPINLALFLFIIRKYKPLRLSHTQADLFSVMLQYIMLAYPKKRKFPDFTPQPGSFLANRSIPGDIRRLFGMLAKKCYDERTEINGVLHVQNPDDLIEYLEFGLFTKGPERNTVVLPHPLFQEYFTAAHVAENPHVWRDLFEEIREKSESQSPRPSLIDILRPMGLENVVRFVVALSPQVCEELTTLFVVERKMIEGCDNYQLLNFEYYAELVRDCGDESEKDVLATAMLKAPVLDVRDTCSGNTQGVASASLPYHIIERLDYTQRVIFLKKIYNLDMYEKDCQLSISGCSKKIEIRDSFLTALAHEYNCHIKTDQLIIRGEENRPLDLVACRLLSNVSAVRLLELEYCRLRASMPEKYKLKTSQQSESSPVTQSSLEKVYLSSVEGLEHCDLITSRQCHVEMEDCDDVRVRTMKTCFPKLSELKLKFGSVLAETEDELVSWLSTIKTVGALGLNHIEGESTSVFRQIDILAKRDELKYLRLSNYAFLLSDSVTGYTARANKTLKKLVLCSCEGTVNLVKFFQWCGKCLQLEEVDIYRSLLVAKVGDASDTVTQNNTLTKLKLIECNEHLDVGALLEVCSQCLQLKELCVFKSQVVVRVRDTSDPVTQNNTLTTLQLSECKGHLDVGALLKVCSQCLQLKKLLVFESQLVVRVRDTSDPVTQNSTLTILQLSECRGDVDLGALLEVCSQCLQLKELRVFESQLVVRVRDTSDPVTQNNTLTKLQLSECRGDVDLGALLEVCSQCLKLKELLVFESQLVVRVRDTSDPVTQNSTLTTLQLSECRGDVDLGALLEVCSQCLQLKELLVCESQLVVRVRDTSDLVTQNSTLTTLHLIECKGDLDVGALLEVCSQCLQLKELSVSKSQLVVRVRDTSDPVTQNSTLTTLQLSECRGDVDLGALLEVCSQCLKLKELLVFESQLVVRVRNTSDLVTQNNTLTELQLAECKGHLDVGALLEVCSQCLQLKELRVSESQLVVRVRNTSDPVTQNNTLTTLQLNECKGHLDVGALLEVCSQCLQLKELSVAKSQLVVRIRDTSDAATQNSTLTTLQLIDCRGVDLGALFEVCSQCLQLKKLVVAKSQLVVRIRDTSDAATQNSTLTTLALIDCRGVDLGALFEVCSQCLQLKELLVLVSQLVVRVRDTSDTVAQNNNLTELQLVECKGDVDLGALFEVCSQCLQLKELVVAKSQLVVRIRDTSDAATQNSTLTTLQLIDCRGVDLGALFEVCSQCLQLKELLVFESQLVVRVRDTSDTVAQNNNLTELQLSECKGDLGALFEVCSQCLQLKKLVVVKSQLVVRIRDTSDTVTQNSILSELHLGECKGDVDLGALFEVCSQCLQLKELYVFKSQLVVRVRDTSDTIAQNNTLSKLALVECKGHEDLGVLFEICSKCLQLTELTVSRSQVVVRVIKISDAVTQNNTLNKLRLSECKGDVDLGALLEVCSQSLQLTELTVSKCQVVVRVRNTSDAGTQNNTLNKLRLSECKRVADLGALFEICSQCRRLKKFWVLRSLLVLDQEKVQSIKQLLELQYMIVLESSVHTPAGQRLSPEEVDNILSKFCPSAQIIRL